MTDVSKKEAVDPDVDLGSFEIEDLEISKFLDNVIDEHSESVSKVMAASCTTCECCCS